MPFAVLMPAPQTSRTFAPAGNGRPQLATRIGASTSRTSLTAASPRLPRLKMTSNRTRARFFCSARMRSRSLPSIMLSGNRSPMPSTAQYAFARTLGQIGMRIERKQEYLRFVDTLFALVRPCAADRRATGRKAECLRRDFGAGERLQSRLRLEVAFDARPADPDRSHTASCARRPTVHGPCQHTRCQTALRCADRRSSPSAAKSARRPAARP